jgi:hypothetical protein
MLFPWHLQAGCNEWAVGRHLTAAGRGALGRDDGGIASGSAIGSQEHLVVGALHGAAPRVAVCLDHPNAESGTRRAGIAFRARRPRRSRFALRPLLTLSAIHHRSGQCNHSEQPQATHELDGQSGRRFPSHVSIFHHRIRWNNKQSRRSHPCVMEVHMKRAIATIATASLTAIAALPQRPSWLN